MKFSLVLATVGRVAVVERFLESLVSQGYSELELIIMDQNDDERLARVVAKFRDTTRIEHTRSARGLSRARNVGLSACTGDVVAFPDDDCVYPNGLLARVAGRLAQMPEADGLTGQASGQRLGFSARFDTKSGWLRKYNAWSRTISFTLFLRRSLTQAVGGFDEALGVGAGTPWGAGEDLDYPLRALGLGMRIFYDPSIVVDHPGAMDGRSPSWRDLSSRSFQYGAGFGRVWRKHRYPSYLVSYYLLRPFLGSAWALVCGDR